MSEGSGFYAIPEQADVKGLVWYPVPEFEEAGYTVPRTWDELLALSRQMVADGRHPWCLGIESGPASGWPATDWIEALVLRLGGVELYDQWVAHEIPFDHPVVRQATSMFGEIAFGPGFVNGGVESINDVAFIRRQRADVRQPARLLAELLGRPHHRRHASRCRRQASTPSSSSCRPSRQVRPPRRSAVPGSCRPLTTGPRSVSSSATSPARRGARCRASRPGSTFAPAHVEFDPEHCRTFMWQIEPSIRASVISGCNCAPPRATASPRACGATTVPTSCLPRSAPTLFWAGMVDYIDSGPSSVDRILAGIEAAWPDE